MVKDTGIPKPVPAEVSNRIPSVPANSAEPFEDIVPEYKPRVPTVPADSAESLEDIIDPTIPAIRRNVAHKTGTNYKGRKSIDERYTELAGMGDDKVAELSFFTTGEASKTAPENLRNILRYEFRREYPEWAQAHPL